MFNFFKTAPKAQELREPKGGLPKPRGLQKAQELQKARELQKVIMPSREQKVRDCMERDVFFGYDFEMSDLPDLTEGDVCQCIGKKTNFTPDALPVTTSIRVLAFIQSDVLRDLTGEFMERVISEKGSLLTFRCIWKPDYTSFLHNTPETTRNMCTSRLAYWGRLDILQYLLCKKRIDIENIFWSNGDVIQYVCGKYVAKK